MLTKIKLKLGKFLKASKTRIFDSMAKNSISLPILIKVNLQLEYHLAHDSAFITFERRNTSFSTWRRMWNNEKGNCSHLPTTKIIKNHIKSSSKSVATKTRLFQMLSCLVQNLPRQDQIKLLLKYFRQDFGNSPSSPTCVDVREAVQYRAGFLNHFQKRKRNSEGYDGRLRGQPCERIEMLITS